MKKRRIKKIKILFNIIMILFLILGIYTVKNMCFIDEEKISVFSSQYEETIRFYYPRGTIKDEKGIAFTNRIVCKDGVNIPENNSVKVGKNFIGLVDIKKDDTSVDAAKGISGLEKVFDEYLIGGIPIKVIADVDANGNIISKESINVFNDHVNSGCDITVTVDYKMQKGIEDILDKYMNSNIGKSACVVVSEIETGKIKAMANYGSELNTCLLSYQPGSVFKTITLGLALEEGKTTLDEEIECKGEFIIDGVKKECNKKGGHGKITVQEAFASSCNYCFYEIAKRFNIYDENKNLIGNEIIDYIKTIGFNSIDGGNKEKLFCLEYDDYYSFVFDEIYNNMDVYNLALGEGKIQMTPLLMNTIMAAVSNDGKINNPFIVEKIEDITGNIVYSDERKLFSLGFSERTCELLKKALSFVCINGTASGNKMDLFGGMAGKTGSAEHIEGRKTHSWFSGYITKENPKYAITCFVEEGGSGSNGARRLFDDVGIFIAELTE